ncbi:MAG: hypothetical protein Q9162_007659 [Coniocarpon cinnabarinum]
MAAVNGGAPNVGHHPSNSVSPPQTSSSLYPPAYAPAAHTDTPFPYGNTSPKYPSGPAHEFHSATQPSSLPLDAGADNTKKPQKRKKASAVEDGKGAVDSDGKQRRTRKPKDPNAPPKKRVKKEDKPTLMPVEAKPSDYASSMYPPSTAATSTLIQASSPTSTLSFREPPKSVAPQNDQFRAPSRPASSGQRYDPVRGRSVDIPSNDRPASSSAYGPVGLKSPVRRPPSIANIVDPAPPSSAPLHSPPGAALASSPAAYAQLPSGSILPSNAPKQTSATTLRIADAISAKDSLSTIKKVDSPQRKPSPKSIKMNGTKEAPPPPLPGSNPLPALTNGDLGKPSNRERKYEEVPNDCIVINVPITKSDGGNYINFLKEVENKYGFDIAHPRVAEHRRRMKEIAAAGAALESVPGSADEMNLDVSEGESDVEVVGQGEGSNSEGAKRKRKVNEKYDLDDDFIDDSEMIWQDQALASRDGYFVWSGPLIQEGDKPTIERADGSVKRGGRGSRGGGRGSTRGDGTRTRGSRGGGPGSRGGTTVRKPRVTKADRARMESEKAEREKMAASATKPVLYPGTVG